MKDSVIIDIEEMMIDNEDVLLSPTHHICIYKVPPVISKLNEDAYSPMVVSIGPVHYGKERLQVMEDYKQVLFKRFKQNAKASLEEMFRFVESSEKKVRASYNENIKLNEKDLVNLILVDAAFIIELFKSSHERKIHNDAKLSQPYLKATTLRDLILLENQLPFFVLEGLFYLPKEEPTEDQPKAEYHLLRSTNELQEKLKSDSNHRTKHFTELLTCCLPREDPTEDQFQDRYHLQYSADELHEAGVRFKPSPSLCLLDFKFSGSILEIPHIPVDDDTKLLFRNMIALEQCHYPFESYISGYAFVMDRLINTTRDVNVLTHSRIIGNWLGDSNDVATLFNELCKNTYQDLSFEYLDICKRLNGFYRDPWHKMKAMKATLRHDYCNTQRKTVGTVVGIIVLILTVIQTICSVLQVVLA